MQNLKIYKKSPVMRNTAVFAVFSMFYLHVLESFVKGVSTFNQDSYFLFFNSHRFLFFTLVLFCLSILSGRKFSKYIYTAFIFQCIYFAFEQYMIALDKFILILNFLFVILSYYFYLFMNSDLGEASNTPLASKDDMYTGLTIDSEICINCSGEKYNATFINWDQYTCFLKIEGSIKNLRNEVQVDWVFEGIKYSSRAFVVSGSPGFGVGLRLFEQENESSGIFGWTEFYDIIQSRGYSPNLTA
ncbi:MAG: hypothetical protein CME70_07785 [Halobacteriovorax sp.]|nr:hypothetical protein [Halobacteriovorax sp.]|tara:strand:- start:279161 stop:279892 length:732 start_codon:yes stop_codon:yes gene_type:complete